MAFSDKKRLPAVWATKEESAQVEASAKQAKLPVATWARKVLLAACAGKPSAEGKGTPTPATRAQWKKGNRITASRYPVAPCNSAVTAIEREGDTVFILAKSATGKTKRVQMRVGMARSLAHALLAWAEDYDEKQVAGTSDEEVAG